MMLWLAKTCSDPNYPITWRLHEKHKKPLPVSHPQNPLCMDHARNLISQITNAEDERHTAQVWENAMDVLREDNAAREFITDRVNHVLDDYYPHDSDPFLHLLGILLIKAIS